MLRGFKASTWSAHEDRVCACAAPLSHFLSHSHSPSLSLSLHLSPRCHQMSDSVVAWKLCVIE